MTRIFITLAITGILFSSCGSRQSKDVSDDITTDNQSVKVEFASLIENPSEYVDKNIEVEGKVVHVCMHTGKKMFIVGDDPDTRLFISAGENAAKFPVELVGSSVTVEGRLEKIVTADKPGEGTMVAGLEKAASSDSAAGENTTKKAESGEDCATEAAVAGQAALSDLMMIYNKHVVVK
ncbi:MAG: hypothetical protein JXR66_00190 [Bacteroidales bacterium]|nr:hypothetical protein [Bacteroidales bacterium]MBN2631942.1 hypothetical protein [Bacteroidales bacterium]